MYFSEKGNVDDDATLITMFLVSFNLQSCCLMQSAVCGLRSAVCGLRSAVCGLRSTVCGLRSAVCGLQSAVCSLQSAVCGLQSAVCSLRSAFCSLQKSYTGSGRRFGCRLYPSHGPLRFITSHSFRARLCCHAKNEAPEEEAG